MEPPSPLAPAPSAPASSLSSTRYAKRVDKMRSAVKAEVMQTLKPAFTKRLRAVRLRNAKRFIELARCVIRVGARLDTFEKRMDVFMETLSEEFGEYEEWKTGFAESAPVPALDGKDPADRPDGRMIGNEGEAFDKPGAVDDSEGKAES
ncbi:unnamed protein product [Symbiodinium sp. CCMP2592]|nr:unnamed protein product [Symbiodinium sp. CCMP2592]CAE7676565.1 unnamed protein product [Symbiodinium sp. CCMP2592]